MTPAPGQRLLRWVGDRLRVRLDVEPTELGWRAFLRTNLTRAEVARAEVVARAGVRLRGEAPFAGASWRDIPLAYSDGGFEIDLALLEVGWFHAKAYVIDASGRQHWPDGGDLGVSVHPSALRTKNLIYCAFPRAFADRPRVSGVDVATLDAAGYTVIPPSGTLRDVTRAVPHIMDTLGFRALHLLPVGPVPTTASRMGRYGSPYAQLDLTGIDEALVEQDRRTTGVDQFRELCDAVHQRDGLVLLDCVLNHTGWGARLMETHPEWYKRDADGQFASPGAWGTTWEDLVELDQRHVPLWHELGDALVTWCHRGVDGFRCDAGYMVPVPAWQYVIARVRQEFPQCVFLLEGLGGGWDATEALLGRGGMQWAYSELFQNYSPEEVSGYLDHALAHSEHTGLLVHYAETHDNERLAKRGRGWSLLRNQLSALASPCGGYAITAGVEWLCADKVDVHEARPLGFGAEPNLLPEIARLTRLLADHPCFFDGAKVRRVSDPHSHVLALSRESADGLDRCLVLVNLDPDAPHGVELPRDAWPTAEVLTDFLGGSVPSTRTLDSGRIQLELPAGASACLGDAAGPRGLSGDRYRVRRAQANFALSVLGRALPHEAVGPAEYAALGEHVARDPHAFLASLPHLVAGDARRDLLLALNHAHARASYPAVVRWAVEDMRRVTPWPPGHWLLVEDAGPFELLLDLPGLPRRIRSTPMDSGHVVALPSPSGPRRDVVVALDRYDDGLPPLPGTLRVLAPRGDVHGDWLRSASRTLLVNGRGGMARVNLDLGRVSSKYDCLLGANLHAEVPCDRHILVKRLRAWVDADGFITALERDNCERFDPRPPARWHFAANAGDGRRVRIVLALDMTSGGNAVTATFTRLAADGVWSLPATRCVSLTLRLDLEDRGYHFETHRDDGLDEHFRASTQPLTNDVGFEFRPAANRGVRATLDRGRFHADPEWSLGLLHSEESTRGLADRGDGWSPGWFELPLADGESATLHVTAEPPGVTARAAVEAEPPADEDAFIAALRRATRAFLARRGSGTTVIAGYPWFLDWGRDSLIAARGLIAAGHVEEVRSLLVTFARFEERGTLPNFLDGDGAGSRETSDAPLWFALACDEYAARVGDAALAEPVDAQRSLVDVLTSIGEHYLAGTAHGVRVDAGSGLVWSPSHFTWMDTSFPAGTPREGYPIELAALFVRLCRLLDRLDARAAAGPWAEWAERAQQSLALYDHPELGWSADTLHAGRDAPAARALADDHLRPNQLFAVSLGLIVGRRAQRMTEAALRHLLIPGALRTLAPLAVRVALAVRREDGSPLNDPGWPYWPRYEGDEDTRRKPAYHNGTAWPWLMPTLCESMVLAWPGDGAARDAARAILGSSSALLAEGCAGQLPEILDGDAPHAQRGCDAQAWSVTEALRVALLLE